MNNKKLILIAIAVVALIGVMLGVYFGTRPQAEEGSKAITVTVVHKDGTSKNFAYKTDAEKLGAFLEEKGLIDSTGADAGMFHTVDGVKLVWEVDHAYWAFYEGDDYASVGIYDAVITDGAVYKLVYTLG